MKKIGIIQPGRLGDIIICLPIAKYYSDKGYRVIWPIFYNLVNDLTEVVDYVTFIPITNNVYDCVKEAKKHFSLYKNIQTFDIAATFPESSSTQEYVELGDGLGEMTFDKFKYKLCNVPFEEKWNLYFNRNLEEEDKIFKEHINVPEYNIIGTTCSAGKINVQFESKYPNIEINENYNIFSWYKALRNAKNIILVDSAMANLVEQCNLSNKKTLITRPNGRLPHFKNNWKIV
jgi:hypothetical protein